MPSIEQKSIFGSFDYVKETQEDLEWADLVTVDLSTYGTSPEANKKLATELIDAVRTKGFFYCKGFDIAQERIDEQFSLGEKFYNLPLEEKMKYAPDLAAGEVNGYRYSGRCLMHKESGLVDRTEAYNIPKFSGHFEQNHPEVIMKALPQIEAFARDLHKCILNPLLVLFAIALELPEDYFLKMHVYETLGEDHFRWMKHSKYTAEENALLNGVWTRGHTDLGTMTLLFRQPVAALQIQDATTKEWRWVKPQAGTVTVNTCDALSFLTGGYVKTTIHRVRAPPKDQQHVDRLGVLYFSRPSSHYKLNTITDSPVLNRLGFTQNEFEKHGGDENVPTVAEWTLKKQIWQQSRTGSGYEDGVELHPGVVGRIYT